MESGAPPLDIRLLGPVVVLVDGRPLAVDTRKATALLACLALEPGPHSRDVIAAMLWPESDDEHARSALRRTLSTLNRALGGRWLVSRRDTVALPPGPQVIVDVTQFRADVAAGIAGDDDALRRAVGLYRGSLLEGFFLRDSPEFDEWTAPRAESLRQDFTTALQHLVQRSCSTADFTGADRSAARWLAADPLNESAYRWRMRAAAWSGDRSGALSHYRDCLRVLEAELGVAPLDETTDLYLAIRSGALPPPAPPAATADPAFAQAAHPQVRPFVGRERELASLATLFESTVPGRVAIIEGEAGAGKTRIVEEFAARAGAAFLWARAYAGEATLAYGPIRELTEAALHLVNADSLPPATVRELAHLVPAIAPQGDPHPPPLDSPGAQVRLFAAVGELLASVTSDDQRGVIVVDDAHWLDTASSELLAFLVHRSSHYRLGVLLILRPEEALAGALMLIDAARCSDATRLVIERLPRAALEAWVTQSLGGPLPDDAVDRLERESEGLPLLIAEYLEVIEHLAASGSWDIPVAARQVFEARIRSLSHLENQVLTAAAVIGRPFAFETLRDASGRTEDEALGTLERLLARRLLREREGPTGAPEWEFTHEKLREAAYASMSATRRRVMHRRLAETLKRAGSAAQAALHLERAGETADAASYYRAAGEEARALFANQEALAHFSSALALGCTDVAPIHRAIGDILLLRGDFGGALTAYEAAAAFATDSSTVRAIEYTLARVYARLGDFEQAEGRFAAALQGDAPIPPGEAALMLADWSLLAHKRDDRARARSLAAQALAVAQEAQTAPALARGEIASGIIARRDGELPAALAHLERGRELSARIAAPELRASALNALALALADVGDTNRALKLAQEALAVCDAQGDRHRAAAVHSNLADIYYARGQRDEARTHVEVSAALLGEIGIVAGAHRPEVWKLIDW